MSGPDAMYCPSSLVKPFQMSTNLPPAAFDARLVEAVEIGHVARNVRRPHRRRADPEERPAIDLERIDHAVDALGIGLLPAVRADRRAAGCRSSSAGGRCDPNMPTTMSGFSVLRISVSCLFQSKRSYADQPGSIVRLVDHGELRLVGKRLVEAPGEAAGRKSPMTRIFRAFGVLRLHFDGGERRLAPAVSACGPRGLPAGGGSAESWPKGWPKNDWSRPEGTGWIRAAAA